MSVESNRVVVGIGSSTFVRVGGNRGENTLAGWCMSIALLERLR
jgi:hypothetical protein